MERTTQHTMAVNKSADQPRKQGSTNNRTQATCMHCGKQFSAPKTYSKFCSHTCSYAGQTGKKRHREKSATQRDQERRMTELELALEGKEALRLTKQDVAQALRRCGLYPGYDGVKKPDA